MVIDQKRIGSKFETDFTGQWPFDVGHLLTRDCLVHGIPIVKVSNETDGGYSSSSSLVNKSVRHFWYGSRMFSLKDEAFIDSSKVGAIRERLDIAYNSDELSEIREFHIPSKSLM